MSLRIRKAPKVKKSPTAHATVLRRISPTTAKNAKKQ